MQTLVNAFERSLMSLILRNPPAPVGQQGPATRSAPLDSWRSLLVARGSLPLTGTASVALDEKGEH